MQAAACAGNTAHFKLAEMERLPFPDAGVNNFITFRPI